MRFSLRSLLALSRSIRQIVINRFNSVSAVGLNFLGSRRFEAMPGTPSRIVIFVKAKEPAIRDLRKGDMLHAFPRSPHGHRCHTSELLAR